MQRTPLRTTLAACAAALALTPLSPAHAVAPTRGDVVSATRIAVMAKEKTAEYLATMSFGSPKPKYGVEVYRVVYRTIAVGGRPTTASGLVVLPRGKNRRLRTVVYEHGTNPTKKAAATVDPGSYDRAASILFAGAGFGTVAPDYLGLGLGPGRHPYMDHASETSASLDMLRAAEKVAARHGRVLDRRVRVTGFSQGGAAAMALGRVLQAKGRLAALAPVSGPYDVEHAEVPEGLHGTSLDPREVTFYLGYWLTSMNRLHHIYASPSEAFRQPYSATVETLFDGDHTPAEIVTGLPATPRELLTPAFIKRFDHPTGGLAQALRRNDDTCTSWTPHSPVRVYAAHGDKDVTIRNAESCVRALRARGVAAPLIDVGDTDHNGSALRSVPRIVTWFSSL
ncbi:alpha/beta fold hydrolase [Actinoallomurus vinaceus]|uniref:Alpha/beta fold hydrolase n=1 Tax=Actinoallomurus vinaceus TaxID=1080074 RepID=A0ABP8TYR6_9ACTN